MYRDLYIHTWTLTDNEFFRLNSSICLFGVKLGRGIQTGLELANLPCPSLLVLILWAPRPAQIAILEFFFLTQEFFIAPIQII